MPRHSENLKTHSALAGLDQACRFAIIATAIMLMAWCEKGFSQSESFEPLQRTIKVLSTNLDGFGIPFKVDDSNGQFIEVQLYISRDRGNTWSFHSRQPTSGREFPFTADGDGEYWFAIKTLDRDRRLLPDGDTRAELKIIVDSSRPKLEFQIDADAAGRVVCRWQASDEGLNASSLKIEYRASAGEFSPGSEIDDSWTSVPVQLKQNIQSQSWTDQLAWWPDTSAEQLEVRIQVADMAGNITSASRYVAVKTTSWRRNSTGSTLGEARPPADSSSSNAQRTSSSDGSASWQPKLRPFANTPEQASTNTTPAQRQNATQQTAQASDNRWRINETASRTTTQPVTARVASAQLPPGVELVDPPEPLDWNEPAPAHEFSGRTELSASPGNSIAWESEVQRHESSERSYSGSTMSPAPGVAPAPSPLSPRSTDSIPSNPATSVRSGKNIIHESTTSWPNNQWNGPTAAKVQPNSELAPRTGNLMPIPRPNRDGFTERPNFSNAAFRKQEPTSIIETTQQLPNQQRLNQEAMPESSNTQIISTKRFQLNYDINAIDPSGVGQIDLWMTRDRGRTWKLWGQDPDNVSPFPVEVVEEGIYGFRIVVRSKDGLAGRGPMRGEEADMWVQVDVTAPLVKITSVPYGRGEEAGQLVINYAVTDSNLTLRPNRLLWSTNPDGPWTTIEENLRNDGRLLWKPRRNVPQRIFLRLESADRAGNVGVHNLEQAIDISGLIPRGTIFGVVPVGE
ncbi:hypothetical protein [Mariniblastus fucicola]|nr:hypothetical protein [Mariniblastus fucicola]